MKVGDLVRVVGGFYSTYSRQDETGIVIRCATMRQGMLILWKDGPALFARPDHLEVISESR